MSDKQTAREARRDAWSSALVTALRAERAAKNMTIATLSDESGVPVSTLKNYLSGRRDIPLSTLVMIADALGIDGTLLWARAKERMDDGA